MLVSEKIIAFVKLGLVLEDSSLPTILFRPLKFEAE